MTPFIHILSSMHEKFLPASLLTKAGLLGAVLLTASACAVVPVQPPARAYYQQPYYSYYDYPPYYTYYPAPVFSFEFDGGRHGRRGGGSPHRGWRH